MKFLLLILILSLIFYLTIQYRRTEKVPVRTAVYLWEQLCKAVNPSLLLKEKDQVLNTHLATYDPDNECYYLEFPAAIPSKDRFLTTITIANEKLILIRIFPPEKMQLPFFCGFIKNRQGQTQLRGWVSDYSDHIYGYL